MSERAEFTVVLGMGSAHNMGSGVMADVAETVRDAFDFVSERGVLGGIYVGSVAFTLLISNDSIAAAPALLPWIAGMCFLLGLILTNVTYELFLPLFRWATNPIAFRAFRNVLGTEYAKHFQTYDQVRRFRELLLASDGAEHFKTRVKKDEKLRQTLTYFATSSLAALTIVASAELLVMLDPMVKYFEMGIIIYVLSASLIGQVSRSYAFGRSTGLAYIGTPDDKRARLLV